MEVGADVAARAGAAAGTFLVPVPGVLPHETVEVPAVWMDRQGERRGSGPMAAVRPAG